MEEKKRAPVSSNEVHPACYGVPELVCPKDENGITQPQAECLGCGHVRSCLRVALKKEGRIRPPLSEVPGVSRVSSFFKRWSDRKLSNTDT